MKIIAAYSNKGGVGKTATAVNLADAAARRGLRTLLIDLDPQAAATFYFRITRPRKQDQPRIKRSTNHAGVKGRAFLSSTQKLLRAVHASDFENLDVLPAHTSFRNIDLLLAELKRPQRRLKQLLKGLKPEYDLIVLDPTPTLSLLAENLFQAADAVLVPVIPTTLCERTYEQLRAFFRKRGYPEQNLLPFFTMAKPRTRIHRDTMARMREKHPGFLDTVIPWSTDVESMGLKREPVHHYAGRRAAGKAYEALCHEALQSI